MDSVQEMMNYIDYANSIRTTHQTVANDTSSRSHAICQVYISQGLNNSKFFGFRLC